MTVKRFVRCAVLSAMLAAPAAQGFAEKKPVTDDAIVDSVKRKLATDAIVKGGALDVDAHEGVVTLKGKVAAQKQKDKAEHLTRKIAGVKSVDNQIVVGPR